MALHLHPGDAEPWGTRLRHMAADVDPALQVRHVTAMDDLLRQHHRSMRLLAGVFVAMTLSVLLLSAAGIYAMMAFSVTQRRREIGIRLALGAGARRILWTMFSQAAAQLLADAALGASVAVLLNRAADGELMKEHAAIATAMVVLLMMVAGLLAALGPARQGLRIPPTALSPVVRHRQGPCRTARAPGCTGLAATGRGRRQQRPPLRRRRPGVRLAPRRSRVQGAAGAAQSRVRATIPALAPMTASAPPLRCDQAFACAI
ncbi:MAG: hypothetical protein H0X67_10340 [Acidobacteria bacterium]|nr:hypothetical protein [Acidobacteriota bacterium]